MLSRFLASAAVTLSLEFKKKKNQTHPVNASIVYLSGENSIGVAGVMPPATLDQLDYNNWCGSSEVC